MLRFSLAAAVLLAGQVASALASDDVGGGSMHYACDFHDTDGISTTQFTAYREHFSEYGHDGEWLEATWLLQGSVIQLFDSFEKPEQWLLSLNTETMEALSFVGGQLRNSTECRRGSQ